MNIDIEKEVFMIESVANNLMLLSEVCTNSEIGGTTLTGLAYTLLEQINKIEKKIQN